MMKSKILFTAAAMAAMMVSAHSATIVEGPLQQAQQALAANAAKLSAETPYINGSDGSNYKVTVVNNTQFDVWMTFYKDQWQYHGQAGQACVPPGKQVVFADSLWGTTGGGDLRGELKSGANCGGSSFQDKTLASATSAPIYSGGTARLVITNVSGNFTDFQGSFTP